MSGRAQHHQVQTLGFRDIFHRLSPTEELLVQLSRRVNETMLGDAVFRTEAAVDQFLRNKFVSQDNVVLLERTIRLCESLMTNIEFALRAAVDDGCELQMSVVREAHEKWQECNSLALRVKRVLDVAAHPASVKDAPVRAASPVRPLAQLSLRGPRRHKAKIGARDAQRQWHRLISTLGLEAGNTAFERYLEGLPEDELQQIELELST